MVLYTTFNFYNYTESKGKEGREERKGMEARRRGRKLEVIEGEEKEG